MQLICVKFHRKKKLHVYWFTDAKMAHSFIDSLIRCENVSDYSEFVTETDIVDKYCDNPKPPQLELIRELDKKDFTAVATKREAEDGKVYEVNLSHPDLGKKRVFYMHEKPVEMMEINSEKELEDFIYAGLEYYIRLFQDEGETSQPPHYLINEESCGYVAKWPPMAE